MDAESFDVPSVVAVLVTADPDETFDAVLEGLASQDYPSLTVLVVDAGSTTDPSNRIGAILPDAFIRRTPVRTTFAAAANEALAAVEGANYLLFLTGDVVLEEDVVSLLVEEAVRSNAGVVGPKFVDVERREVLLEVGMAADKLGVPARRVEPGEIDHEQHDAVRDVFAVPSATMLVRGDLWAELGGFDAAYVDEVAEVDLCWRARLAGARVLVVPDAVARRPFAALRERFGPDPDAVRHEEPTQRLQMLLRNYSSLSLLRVLPQAAVVATLRALMLAVMGRPRRAWSVARAWLRNLRQSGETLRARRAVQGRRAVSDAEVRSLQVRGFSYVRAFFAGQLDLGNRVEALSGAGRDLAHNVTGNVRRPSLTFGAILSLVVLAGSRELITGSVPAVGSFVPWAAPGDAFREFTSAWRYVGVGVDGASPPGLALMGSLSTLLAGSAAFARTAVIVAAIPLGAYGAFRLALPLARTVWGPLAAATAYAIVPLPRNAIGEGRLGPLVFYALAPFIYERVLTASGLDPFARLSDGRPAHDRRRAILVAGLLTALTAAVFAPALALVPLFGVGLFVAAPLAGARGPSLRGLVSVAVVTLLAVALLFPWSVGLLLPTPDMAALGFNFRETPTLVETLTFDTGPARTGISWLLLAVAAHPLLVGSGPRLRWVTRGWMLAVVGWAAAWLPGRLDLDVSVPTSEGTLVVAALGIAMAVGLGAGVLRDELTRAGLSWRQGLSVVAITALGVAALPFMVDALDGRWGLPTRDWGRDLQWMESEASDGGFRVLWVGEPDVLPLDPLTLDDGTGFGLTRNGPPDALALWPPPTEGATDHVRDALEAAIADRTERLGHMLGPLAVRYIAVPLANGPGQVVPRQAQGAEDPPVPTLVRALSRQIDLAELSVDPGLLLLENRAWVPAGALVTGETAQAVVDAERRDAVRLDVDVARPVGRSPRAPDVVVPEDRRDLVEGLFILGEAYDEDWRVTSAGALRPHARAFGLVNAFSVEDVERISVSHQGQLLRYGALGVEAAIWVLVMVDWRRRRVAERRELRAWREALRDVRPGAPRVLEEVPA